MAYKRARMHKRSKDYQLKFEHDLEAELFELYNELMNRTYKPQSSTCFIIHYLKFLTSNFNYNEKVLFYNGIVDDVELCLCWFDSRYFI